MVVEGAALHGVRLRMALFYPTGLYITWRIYILTVQEGKIPQTNVFRIANIIITVGGTSMDETHCDLPKTLVRIDRQDSCIT